MSNKVKVAFNKVKPFCIKVSRERNTASVQHLCDEIKQLPSNVVQELHEYLLFPLRVIFVEKNNIKEDVIVASADAIQNVFQKAEVNEWKTFEDLFHILILPITSFNNQQISTTGTEDIKLSILSALLTLLKSSLSKHCDLFYHVNHYPFIGHMISICLEILSNEKNKELRKTAICVVRSLCITPNKLHVVDIKLTQVVIGDCMASFLPGIVSGLLKVVSGDTNQGQAVKCLALDTIGKILTITASDENVELACGHTVNNISKETVNSKLFDLKVKRDSLWLENLSGKVEVIMQHVITASDHLNVNVRLSVIEFARKMLLSCSKFLFKTHIGSLIKIPCKLLHDSVEAVALRSQKVIEEFSSQSKNNANVTDILQEELFNLCSALPKVVSKASDLEKGSALKLVLGIIEVLKFNLQSIISSTAHVNNLLKSIVFCFQMDCSELYKVEEVSSTSVNFDKEIKTFFHGQSKNWFFKKSFLHFQKEEICQTLIKLCRLLGKYGDLDILFDSLKERYESEKQCRPAVLIMNELLLGAMENAAILPDIFQHIDCLLDLYTSNENWYLCTSYDSLYGFQSVQRQNAILAIANTKSKLSLKTINANIVLVCLHLEALATFSIVLSKDFRKTLIKSLYPLLEKVTDRNHVIRNCALKALEVIAISSQYKDIAELINKNADYLVSSISIHLRHLGMFPRSPAVLQAMLTHSDVAVFPLIRDTVDEILFTLDLHRLESRFLLSFLPVLIAAVKAINSWFSDQLYGVSNQADTQIDSKAVVDSDSIVSHLVGLHNNFKVAAMCSENCNFEDDSNLSKGEAFSPFHQDNESENYEKDIYDDEKRETPGHVKVVENILHRSFNLLANEDPKVRLMVMDIIDQGMFCLRKEKDVLLPLVHKLWSPLAVRCMDVELQIAAKAFTIICNIGDYSGSFMRRRFTKDVLPKLLLFFKKHAQPNLTKVSTHTTLFKLQVTVLNRLGRLLLSADVSYKDLNSVSTECQGYLSSRQHKEIQTAAVCLFKSLILLDPDSMWLFLNDIVSPTSSYSSNLFRNVAVAGTSDLKSEYAANVFHLLSFCPC